MEEEFSHVVGINIVLWLLVLLWIMLPSQVDIPHSHSCLPRFLLAACCSLRVCLTAASAVAPWLQAYHMFWLSGFSVVAVLIVGIKLQSIVISLAQDAYRVYGSPDSECYSLQPFCPSACSPVALRGGNWVATSHATPHCRVQLTCTVFL
jgi:hypothetical protein